MTTEVINTLSYLRRARWVLWGIVIASAVLAWGFPLLWALTIIALVFAVWCEVLIYRFRRRDRYHNNLAKQG